jgi:hypothetical protein
MRDLTNSHGRGKSFSRQAGASLRGDWLGRVSWPSQRRLLLDRECAEFLGRECLSLSACISASERRLVSALRLDGPDRRIAFGFDDFGGHEVAFGVGAVS